MNKEDFPLVKFNGRRLRRVPEVADFDKPGTPQKGWERCMFCYAYQPGANGGNRKMEVCSDLREMPPGCNDESGRAGVFVPEENFTEYVVEFVRRRIS